VELEEAEQYFKSEKFQANYHAYVMESQKIKTQLEHEISERARKQAEYAASPEYQKELAEKKARIEREQMRDSIEQEILQTLHDALARAGARCEDYDDDYRCC
jgi:uncharacterized membrane protein YheB (UPF0754 family)